jgi:hypothetical protein
MHIHHKGIESTWTQVLDFGKYVRIFIWDNKDDMWSAIEKVNPIHIPGTYYGLCTTTHVAVNKKTKKRKCGKKFAELHLLRDQIGGGYIAHEIYHLVNFWSEFLIMDPQHLERDDEILATLTGDLTSTFWVSFYARYSK